MTPGDPTAESEPIQHACALVEAEGTWGTQRGTAYLVRSDWAVTCAHVVRGVPLGEHVLLHFPQGPRPATVKRVDAEADCALLHLDQPMEGVAPLWLSPSCSAGSPWEAYGYIITDAGAPASDPGLEAPGLEAPLPEAGKEPVLHGEVQEPDGEDLCRGPAVVLRARDTTPMDLLRVLSGSPIVARHQVIGHLKQVVPDEATGSGVVYACPARHIESLLPPDTQKRQPQPPKSAYDPAWYVHRPDEESMALDYLSFPGKPVVLWGPELFGKTWLLKYLLNEVRKRDEGRSRTVLVNLELFDLKARSSLDSFLRELAIHVVTACKGRKSDVDSFWVSDNPMSNFTWLLEQSLLPKIAEAGGHLYLAIDRADTVWGCPFQNEFFGLLRAWAENGVEEEPWQYLHLLLAVSTTPALLIQNPVQSPFNLSEPVRLSDLGDQQIGQLADLYGVRLGPADLEALKALVGGHPYLVRLLFYTARRQNCPLLPLLEGSNPRGDVFEGFLERTLSRLQQQPAVLEAFFQLLEGRDSNLERDARHRLERAGLIVRDEQTGVTRPRYQLYRRLRRTSS